MSTTTLVSTPTKLKRIGSIMLSPSKRSRPEPPPAQPSKPPTHKELFNWALSPEAVVACHIRDVLSLEDRTTPASEATNKHSSKLHSFLLSGESEMNCRHYLDPDFFWLGRVPCRNVQVVALVVGVTQYEERASYICTFPVLFVYLIPLPMRDW